MRQIQQFTLFCTFLMSLSLFLCSASVLPAEGITPKNEKTEKKKQASKLQRIEARITKMQNPKKKARLEKRVKKIKYGERGDALGLAALIVGILSILMSLAVLLFLGIEWNLLVYIGLLFGVIAIIVAIVDMRYTDYPGQAIAAMIAGGLAVIAGIVALIVVK